jgi:hypothetical protein
VRDEVDLWPAEQREVVARQGIVQLGARNEVGDRPDRRQPD